MQYLKQPLRLIQSSILSIFKPPFVSPTVDLHYPAAMPSLRGVNHPAFSRLSATSYLLKVPDGPFSVTLHVGQVADYLHFDERVRAKGGIDSFQSIPLGFIDFATIWNSGVRNGDPRRLSKIFLSETPELGHFVELPHTPVCLTNFFITPEQVGLGPDLRNDSTSAGVQNEIMQEFATMMMDKRRSQRRGYEERREKRLRLFNKGYASNTSGSSNPLSNLRFGPCRRHRENPSSQNSNVLVPFQELGLEPSDEILPMLPTDDVVLPLLPTNEAGHPSMEAAT